MISARKLTLALAAAVAIAAVSVTLATGTTANLTWIAPTAYVDNTPLPASDIDHYTVTWAPATGQVGASGSMNVPGTLLATVANVLCGNTTFTVAVTTTATAHYPNQTSGPSGSVPYATGVSCNPNPPTGLAAH